MPPDRRADRRPRPDRRGRARAARAADLDDGAPRPAARDDAPGGARRLSPRRRRRLGAVDRAARHRRTAPTATRTTARTSRTIRGQFHWDQGVRRLALGAFMVGERAERGAARIASLEVAPEELRPEQQASAATYALLVRSLCADADVAGDARGAARDAGPTCSSSLVDDYLAPRDDDADAATSSACARCSPGSRTSISTAARVGFREAREHAARRLATRARQSRRAARRRRDDRAARRDARACRSASRSSSGSTRARSRPAIGPARSICGASRAPATSRRATATAPRSSRCCSARATRCTCRTSRSRRRAAQPLAPSSVVLELADALAPYLGAGVEPRGARRDHRAPPAASLSAAARRAGSVAGDRARALGGRGARRAARPPARRRPADPRRGRPARAARASGAGRAARRARHRRRRRRRRSRPPHRAARRRRARSRSRTCAASSSIRCRRGRRRCSASTSCPTTRRSSTATSRSTSAAPSAPCMLREVFAAQLRDPRRAGREPLRRRGQGAPAARPVPGRRVRRGRARARSRGRSTAGAPGSGRSPPTARPGSGSAARRRRAPSCCRRSSIELSGGRTVRLVGQTELLVARRAPHLDRHAAPQAREAVALPPARRVRSRACSPRPGSRPHGHVAPR